MAALLIHSGPLSAAAEEPACDPLGDFRFVCGPVNAEDMVLVPGTNWILASSLSPEGGIYLVDATAKTWEKVYPGPAPVARPDTATYRACPSAPDPQAFVTHGLNLQTDSSGRSTLFVVGHGGREAIEAFDIDTSDGKPLLAWKGCVPTPDGMAANSVASLPDGSLLATIPLHSGFEISAALAGIATGGVYAWSPGDPGFVFVEGTAMPYANGIEVSADGSAFYVASSGLFNVTSFSNTNPARVLRRSAGLGILPDNLHRDQNGQLLTAGLNLDDPACGRLEKSDFFDFPAFMACPRAFTVIAVDPETLQTRVLARGPANPEFSNITMALPVAGELWIGTFYGDRIAFRALIENP